MAFKDKDKMVVREVSERVMSVRKDRNDSYEEEPKHDIWIVKDIDGHATHFQLPRERMIELYTRKKLLLTVKYTLEDWDSEIIDALEGE